MRRLGGAAFLWLLHLGCSTPSQQGAQSATETGRCSIRLTSKGSTVDGDPADRDQVVERCKPRAEALVEVAGDASDDQWRELRTALEAAGVRILMRGPRGLDDCSSNPLAKGCM